MSNDNNALEEQVGTRGAPPYIPYLTFRNFIDWMETEGVPLRLDRSVWARRYSGSTGSQLLVGLRFLGLLQGEEPTARLEKIVEAKGEDRRELLRELLQSAYDAVRFDDLPRATPAMLREWIAGYGIDGDTVRKAESFFINAAKDLDIPMAGGLRKMARNRPAQVTARTPRSATRGRSGRQLPQETTPPPPSPPVSLGGDDRAEAQASLMLWGLFKRLPAPGDFFGRDDREAWVEAARTLFNLEYKDA